MQVAITSQRSFIDICEESRKSNIAVFGIKNTGKAFTMIPGFFDQDLKIKDKGITIVVNTPELAWYLYGMAKVEGRKVDILKPSIKFEILNNLLFRNEWDFESIKKIYDFERAIKDKRITIIDMEEEKYGEKAVRGVSMLLLQLQAAMVLDKSKKTNYSVYIDDAGTYMPYIKNLLKYGDFYGFMTTLFFKSREELGNDVILLDSFVRNFILLQGINYADAKYFSERMNIQGDEKEDGAQKIMNREYGSVLVEYIEDKTFKRKIEEGSLIEFPEDKKKEFMSRGNQFKKKYKEIDTKGHYQLTDSAALLDKDSKDGNTYLENIKENVENTVEEIEFDNNEDILNDDEIEVNELDTPDIPDEVLEEPEIEVKPQIELNSKKKVEFRKKDEFKKERGKEPQLNQHIKPTNVKQEKRTDFSLLDEFDLPGDEPEKVEEIEEIDPVEADIQEFDLDVPDNLDEIEIDDSEITFDVDLSDEPEELEPIDLPEEKSEEFNLEPETNTTFSIGGNKNRPYKKIKNPKIEKSLQGFTIK